MRLYGRKAHRGLIPVLQSLILRKAWSSVDRRGGSRASLTCHSRLSVPGLPRKTAYVPGASTAMATRPATRWLTHENAPGPAAALRIRSADARPDGSGDGYPGDPGRGGDPDPGLLLRRTALGLVRRPGAGAVDHRRDRVDDLSHIVPVLAGRAAGSGHRQRGLDQRLGRGPARRPAAGRTERAAVPCPDREGLGLHLRHLR